MKLVFSVLSLFAALAAVAEKPSYGRYESIVDRQMFGVPPQGFDPMKLPSEVARTSQKELTKEQEKLQSSVHFSVINVAPDGTPVVGFTDNGDPKAPVHHYIKVGEESGGWKVLAADPAQATMTIAKNGVELTLKLGDKSGKGGGGEAVPAVAAQRGGIRQSPLLGMQSLRGRRRLRMEQQEAERKQQEEARAQREQEERVQREQEREEQRQQLRALQESLTQLRAEKQAKKESQDGEQTDANDNAQ
jgi:hypothetical protein